MYSSSESHNWWSPQYTVQESPAKITPLLPNATTDYWPNNGHVTSAAFGRHKFNLNNEVEEEEQNSHEPNTALEQDEFLKQPLFEKSLTPSDVGKLNRLVIPKQHAEKYFPINGGDSSDQKGLLLNFEDEVGKFWEFRYSYWNSSQSYVLTKGWSRFVKEKRLDAGDVVLFCRHRVDATRLFIGWRRRGADEGGAGGGWNRGFYSLSGQQGCLNQNNQGGSSLAYQAECVHAGSSVQNLTTVSGNFKRLRLFGVNLECRADESEPSTPEDSPMSGQGQAHPNPYNQFYTNHQNHMQDMIINFSGGGDVYRQG